MLRLSATAAGVRIDLRVIPRSPRDAVDGVRDGRLVVRVTAPPVDDAANEAVVVLLAQTLGVPRRMISIAAGATARNKTVVVSGLDAAAARARLPV
jgi:uncharacterized protein YggU (UPF0235/DUF167 family)